MKDQLNLRVFTNNDNDIITILITDLRLEMSVSPLSEQFSNEGLALETSAFKSLYGGQFTSSDQLIKPSYLAILIVLHFYSFYSDMVQYIPNEVSTKPAVKEDDKGQCLFTMLGKCCHPDIHVFFM